MAGRQRLSPEEHRARALAWLAFIEENGRQPGNKPDAPYSESSLYYWINKLRRADTRGAIAPDVRAVLDEVAPEWREARDPSRPNPEMHAQRAAEYRAFQERNGRKPSQMARYSREAQLHTWMTNQRSTLATGRMHPEVRDAISAILPGWDSPSDRPSRDTVVAKPFAERLDALRAYMDANDGLLPPSQSNDGGADGSLGRWLHQQRRLLRRGELKRSRKRALDQLAPGWSHELRSDQKWRRTLDELASFVAENGRLPRNSRSGGADEYRLQTWLQRARSRVLDAEQVAALDNAVPGWRGGEVRDSWAARVREIQQFIDENGHRPRPQGATPEERRMGFWLTRQRHSLREGKLSEAAAQLLTEVLPGWEVPDKQAPGPRGPRKAHRLREPSARSDSPDRGRALPSDRHALINLAQLDVSNRNPTLPVDDPYRYARKVVNRYLKLAARAASEATSTEPLHGGAGLG